MENNDSLNKPNASASFDIPEVNVSMTDKLALINERESKPEDKF